MHLQLRPQGDQEGHEVVGEAEAQVQGGRRDDVEHLGGEAGVALRVGARARAQQRLETVIATFVTRSRGLEALRKSISM